MALHSLEEVGLASRLEGAASLKPLFSAFREAAGLSLQGAATLFNVRLDTVKSWNSGRRTPSEEVLTEARAFLLRQEKEAAKLAAAHRGRPQDLVPLLAADDARALEQGWPSAGAYNVAVARAWALAAAKEA